ncbi:MAG: tRNA lysidine(34) synthetase TilS [Pirellulaceae bacterium]
MSDSIPPSVHPPSDEFQGNRQAWNQLTQSLADSWPPGRWANVGVVIGCSGGADSVALVRLLHAIAQSQPSVGSQMAADTQNKLLAIAHFDHGLRGNESDDEREFVIQLANDLRLPHYVGTGDASRSDEASLRAQRHAFLIRTAAQTGCRYIALAHSLDDNVETVLHHLMRGTGPAGLAGIAPTRAAGADAAERDFVIKRPLLAVRRELIRDGLREIGQTWREDSSNTNTDYQRNWIRGELLPLMQSRYPEVVPAIGRAIESQREWKAVIETAANQWIDQNVFANPLTIRRHSDHDPSITIAALQSLWQANGWSRTAMTQRHWQQLVSTLQGNETERYTLPGEIDVVANTDDVTISRATAVRRIQAAER